MEINWLTDEKNKIEFEIKGENHTLCNAVRQELWNVEDTNIAAYKIEHPLVSNPVMIVETSKTDAKKALHTSIENLRKKVKELREAFSKSK